MRTLRNVFLAGILSTVGAGATNAAPITFTDFIAMGRVSDPQISPDGQTVVFVVTRYGLDSNRGNSDLYAIPIRGGAVRQLTWNEKSDNQPRFSPDGKRIAFTSSRSGSAQIWILPVAGGEATQLTTLSTSAGNPVWTPDGRNVLFASRVYPDCKGDSCNAERIAAEEESKTKARVFDSLFYVHWDEWRDARRSHVFTVPADGGTPVDLTPGPYDVPTIALGGDHDIAVSPDGAEVCVVANTSASAATSINNDLFVVGASGGEWKRITANPANDNNPAYSPDGRFIAFLAMTRIDFEADRYRVKLYDRRSGAITDLGAQLADKFDRSASGLQWSPDSKSLYVTCEDLGYVSLYRVDARSAAVKRLTKQMTLGEFSVSRDGGSLVFMRQDARMPYELFASDKDGGGIRKLTGINDEILGRLDLSPLEEFQFAGAEATTVHGWLLKPPGFDPARTYPMIYLVHGGPQGAWSDNFHWRWNYQMFAAPGYVVVAVNPRGSTGYGQKFTDEISGDWGGKVYVDLMNGLDHVLGAYPFIDKSRVAAAGGSYGGYMMNWMAGHTDRFVCYVNHDGLYNLESFYGATEELWFPNWDLGGAPWENPENYRKWSPHNFVNNFKTPMLVIHGGLDFRVPLAEGMQVFTALQQKGIPSRFLYFPDEGHWVLKPQNMQLWWETVHDWIGRYAAPVALP